MLLNELKNLKNGDGLTLKGYKTISYKTGYQVGLRGREAKTVEEAVAYIDEFKGTAGIWFYDNIYYIDESKHIKTKREAIKTGREYNQISILRWQGLELIYL